MAPKGVESLLALAFSTQKKTIGTKISACATPDVILVGFGSKAAVGEARSVTYQGV